MKLSWRKVGQNWRVTVGGRVYWTLDNQDCIAMLLERLRRG